MCVCVCVCVVCPLRGSVCAFAVSCGVPSCVFVRVCSRVCFAVSVFVCVFLCEVLVILTPSRRAQKGRGRATTAPLVRPHQCGMRGVPPVIPYRGT